MRPTKKRSGITQSGLHKCLRCGETPKPKEKAWLNINDHWWHRHGWVWVAAPAEKERNMRTATNDSASARDYPKAPAGKKAKAKVATVLGEFKEGALHSGSKEGPKVTSRKQAVAIALSEARKAKKK
jgi:Family of unknown function (DUF6496)